MTEKEVGSDATNLTTTVKQVGDHYVLNGNKRWIGNGNKDILVVFAKNLDHGNKIEGFIVDMKSQGVKSEVLQRKLAMRIVENCQISFENVSLPLGNKLPKANDFSKGVNQILLHSRVFLPWLASGICMGSYDHAIKYQSERTQFGSPLSSFQLS